MEQKHFNETSRHGFVSVIGSDISVYMVVIICSLNVLEVLRSIQGEALDKYYEESGYDF